MIRQLLPGAVLVVGCVVWSGPARAASADTTATASPRQAPPAPATLDALLARLRAIIDSSGTPGASLAIVRHDSVLFAGGLGRARLDPPIPATAATLFRIGSSAKILIGLTALQLERDGLLSLQEPLQDALPGVRVRNRWEATDPIRLVHLLEHTSGIDDNSIKAYASDDPRPLTLADGLAIDSGRLAARWRPGTRFAYSNLGPALVARIIELRTGQPFETVVQAMWFDRLGMRTATYFMPTRADAPLATLYFPGNPSPIRYWHAFARPIGALNASATDMAALVRLLSGRGVVGGDTILHPPLLARAERSTTWIGNRVGLSVLGYGLGLYRIEGDDGRPWAGHAGGLEGALSDVSYLPEAGVGYSLQINTTRGRTLALMGRTIRAFLTRDLPAPTPPPPAPLSPRIAREFAGWYRPVTPRPQIVASIERLVGLVHVRPVGATLQLHPLIGDSVVFVPLDQLTFRTRMGSAPTLAFHHGESDAAGPTMEGFSQGATFTRLAAWDVAATAVSTIAWLVALVLAPLGAVIVIGRTIVVWVRRRRAGAAAEHGPLTTPLDAGWWCAAAASGAVVLFGWSAILGFQDVRRFGSVSLLSVAVATAPWLYILAILVGAWSIRRGRGVAASCMVTVSRWALGAVLLALAIGAVYAARYGLVGYRPWA